MARSLPGTARAIPFRRFLVVAAAGMVAFLSFWEGFFTLFDYRPCTLSDPSFVVYHNFGASAAEFGISLVALTVLFNGARRLQDGFGRTETAYTLVVVNLLVSEGLLSFIFLKLASSCVG